LPLTFLFIWLSGCTISDKTWSEVKDRLKVIQEKDRQYRSKMDSVGKAVGWQSEAIAKLWEKQRVLDSANLAEIDNIITMYGYPSKAHVGEFCTVPFEVIRHAEDTVMASYLQIIVGAGKNGDIRMDQVASFEDRVLVAQRQPQEYGTQIWIDFKEDARTKERYDSVYLWPVRDPGRVDSKRASVGLDSLSKQLNRFGIDPARGYLLRKKSGT
jgi:hypothetical protein